MTIQEQLRALVRRHHANFAEQIAVVERLLTERDERGCVPATRIAEAQAITHQMKGTAGSMGFPQVGAAANALDESLKVLKLHPEQVSDAQLRQRLALLSGLQRIARETTPEMSTLYNADLTRLAR